MTHDDGVYVGDPGTPSPQPSPPSPPPSRKSSLSPWLIAAAVVVVLVAGLAIWRFMAGLHPAPAVADSSTTISPDQETDPLWKKCESPDQDTVIDGCGAIIAANTETPRNLATAHSNRGFAYRKKNRNDLALPDFVQAIRLNPNDPAGYEGRGAVEVNNGQIDQAAADYDTEIRLAPDASGGYKGRADVDANRGDWPAALADNSKALQIEPTYEEALEGRGAVYAVMKQWDLAYADDTAALKLNPNSAAANLGVGEVLAQKGQYAQAIPYYDQSVAQNAQDTLEAVALHARAVAKMFTGDMQGAVADQSAAKNLYPKIPDLVQAGPSAQN
jgi:tetratricopeptide (TPR) repeat protein